MYCQTLTVGDVCDNCACDECHRNPIAGIDQTPFRDLCWDCACDLRDELQATR